MQPLLLVFKEFNWLRNIHLMLGFPQTLFLTMAIDQSNLLHMEVLSQSEDLSTPTHKVITNFTNHWRPKTRSTMMTSSTTTTQLWLPHGIMRTMSKPETWNGQHLQMVPFHNNLDHMEVSYQSEDPLIPIYLLKTINCTNHWSCQTKLMVMTIKISTMLTQNQLIKPTLKETESVFKTSKWDTE